MPAALEWLVGRKNHVAVDLRGRLNEMRRHQRATAADFVSTELDLAITFCRIALSTHNQNKINRNVENASRARESALHFLEDSHPTLAVGRGLHRKLSQLESLLRELHIDPTAAWRSLPGDE